MTTTLAFIGPIGYQELIVLAVLGLLIFGKRLPEVGRSLGKGIVEFKKGLSGVEDELKRTNDPTPPADSNSKPDQLNNDSSPQASHSQNESTKTHQ